MFGGGLVLPLLPLYAKGTFEATPLQATFLSSLFFLAQFISSAWIGKLSDKVGRRPILIISQLGRIVSFIIFILAGPIGVMLDNIGFSNIGFRGGLFVLYVGRTLGGFSAGNVTTARAYMSDISNDSNRTIYLGMISASFALGQIFGPAVGGMLSKISAEAPFIGGIIVTGTSTLMTILFLPESLPKEARENNLYKDSQKDSTSIFRLLSNRTVLLVLSICFLSIMSFSTFYSTFPLFADKVIFSTTMNKLDVTSNVGFMLAFLGIISVITQLVLIRPLNKSLGDQRTIIVGQFAFLIGTLCLSMFSPLFLILIALVPIAFGRGVTDVSVQGILTRFGNANKRGQLLGLFQSTHCLASFIGPLLGGLVFERVNPKATYVMLAFFLATSFALSIILKRRRVEIIEDTKLNFG
jgi:DHA1 family tetracycline resistance protein-like MFS transporter